MEFEIEVLTPHAQPVPGARVQIKGAGVDCPALDAAPGIYRATVPAAEEYSLIIERPDLAPGTALGYSLSTEGKQKG